MPEDLESIACPTCGARVAIAAATRPAAFPFCSARCRTRDLGAWAEGRYTVAGDTLSFDPYAPDLDHP